MVSARLRLDTCPNLHPRMSLFPLRDFDRSTPPTPVVVPRRAGTIPRCARAPVVPTATRPPTSAILAPALLVRRTGVPIATLADRVAPIPISGPFVARPAGSPHAEAPDEDRLLAVDLVRPNRDPI